MTELVFYPPVKAAQLTRLPVVTSPVPAGFPAAPAGVGTVILDLHQYLFDQPPSTCMARVTGESMRAAGIGADDFIVVNRALEALDGHVVVAVVAGKHTIRRLRREQGRIWLEAGSHRVPAATPDAEPCIWGVVTHVLHPLCRKRA